VGAARNTGLRAAAGSLIAFLDSDDIWVQRKLEMQAAYLEAHPEIDLIFCQMKPFRSPEIIQTLRFDAREIVACNAGALLARREVFARAGLFSSGGNLPEFLDWFQRASDAGATHYILPDLLLLRRVHLTNMVQDPRFKLAYVHFLKRRLDRKRDVAPSQEIIR
jgi:hypothetical protein